MKIRQAITILVIALLFLLPACSENEGAFPNGDMNEGENGEFYEYPAEEEFESEEGDEIIEEEPAEEEFDEQAEEIEEEPSEETTGEPQGPTSDLSNLVADIGFRPEVNGFGFENYGYDVGVENLTPAEMQRMFGDEVCAILNDDGCVLTPPAEQWMGQINEAMTGGHCEGMATLSLLMHSDLVEESQYGAEEVVELPFEDSDLQREIAYWWTTQTVEPTVSSVIRRTPTEILDILLAMQPGGETYTIGIFKWDFSGGHAITPFGVADLGDGRYAVKVYDNNYPGEARELIIDTNTDTWQYEASINPQVKSVLYEGDAESMTLELTPTSARLGLQVCPFCYHGESAQLGKGRGVAMTTAQEPQFNEIFLDGDGHLLMVDDDERYLGYLDGQFVNQIPGARIVSPRTGGPLEDDPEPIYWLPRGINTTIQLDGSTLNEESPSDLVLVGPGYTFGVEGISLEPGQVDLIYFAPEEGWLTYETDKSQSPNIIIGIEEPEADFYFEIQGADMEGGGTINVLLDTSSGDMIINAEKLTNEGAFNLVLTRIDDELEQEFYADDLVLKAGSILYINYEEWEGDGAGLLIGVDLDGDGEIDETYEAVDE